MEDKPTLLINTVEHLPNGAVRWYRRYSDGFGVGGVYWPDAEPVECVRNAPAEMHKVSSSAIRRMEDAARDEAERAYLESRWDDVWASPGGENG
jgi:hypothetical protein